MDLASRMKTCRSMVPGLSARALSVLAGLSPPTVASIESGKRGEAIEARTLVALAAVLGTTTEYLLDGTGDAPSERRVRAAVERARAEAA